MNYFILLDDKFANGLIEEIESVSIPGSNRYYIRGNSLNKLHVTHPGAQWLETPASDSLQKIFSELKADDQLFIDWYDLFIGKLVLTIDPKVPVHVLLMGGDFYCEPLYIHDRQLYDTYTQRYVKRTTLFPKVWARRPDKLIRQYWNIYGKKKVAQKDLLTKATTIQRINSICINRFATGEIESIKKMYNAERIVHRYFSWNQNFDTAQSLKQDKMPGGPVMVQVGNSATETNNHLDLLPKLAKFFTEDVSIILPLAYGKEEYATVIKDKGDELFPGKIVYKEKFVGREKYVKDLNSVDICIMYHNRSQALGNCVTLLALGKKLFLKKENPLYGMFLKMGVMVFDAGLVEKISFEEFKAPLSEQQKTINVKNLSACFSYNVRMEELKALVN